MILDWTICQGFGEASVTAIELSVGAAVTITRHNGARFFMKVWPGTTEAASLTAQMHVQAALSAGGYPAPALLTKLSALGPGWAIGMEYNRTGSATDARLPGVRHAMAVGLAQFVVSAEPCRDVDGLPRRSLPARGSVWPKPHNALFDFQATAESAEWIDEIASLALGTMRSAGSRVVVGHHDWSAKNMRMGADGISVLYDWDAVFLDHETFVLGSAAAHFPVTWELDVPETPDIGEVVAFVHDYEQARGAAFTPPELAEVAASATYARAYKARCEHAIDPQATCWRGSSRESLRRHGAFRFG